MPKPQPETLDSLMAQNCHLHHMRAHQLFEAIGLYRGQPPVLFALWEREGQTQTELAEKLRIAPATITKMLQRMEKTGFVQRKPDVEDQRISRVYLTEAGHAVQNQVEAVWKTMEAETFEHITAEERDVLHRFLLQIRQNLLHATGEKL
jgi:MarR family transcriptional regulator, organic hydroperoxide resistance regulator